VISWPLGWWYPGPRLNRINRVLISTRCIFFFGSVSWKNLQVKRVWLGAIWHGWPTEKFSRVRMSEDKVRTKDSCWSVETIYDPCELPGVSTAGPGIGRGVTTRKWPRNGNGAGLGGVEQLTWRAPKVNDRTKDWARAGKIVVGPGVSAQVQPGRRWGGDGPDLSLGPAWGFYLFFSFFQTQIFKLKLVLRIWIQMQRYKNVSMRCIFI
jgi:hypothetical protein